VSILAALAEVVSVTAFLVIVLAGSYVICQRSGLSDSARIDPERLRLAVADDLLRDKLLAWLESHCTLTPRAAEAPEQD